MSNESSFFSMQFDSSCLQEDQAVFDQVDPFSYTIVESTKWSYFADPKLVVHFPFASMKQVNDVRRALLVKTDCVAIDSAMIYINTSS